MPESSRSGKRQRFPPLPCPRLALVARLIVQGTHICASAILVESYLSFNILASAAATNPSW
jgi:hypothetical protein